ncbi:hypothetical protein I203_107551 [Kwoniella mangroviensis CBS 8507]|uniref:Kinetochore protein NDC80 n=1 Tax=Kwoniella mangrovensis TaxID=463800 RepID=N0E8N4_9TREE|nr:kinetochore protein NDC80 [Kwoniella mangroviensis CBS 8507]OCF68908.1 kinetochore protein NDC80 [Kwoniella mangroviensis CBS 8507]CCM73222.1 CNE02670p [Kwoniella mangrovensis]
MSGSGHHSSRRSTLASRPADLRDSRSSTIGGTGGDGGFMGRTPQTTKNMPSSVRRNSVFASTGRSRASMAPGMYTNLAFRDPRPIRDKGFQSDCMRNVNEFLVSARYPAPISSKTLVSPTAKEFQSIFRFLIDTLVEQGTGWSKKFEDDALMILKDLKYPGMDTISKTAFTAPGAPQSWFGMLGMLNWLVELCKAHENWNDGHCISDPILSAPHLLPLDHPHLEDRLLWDFASRTYDQWFDGGAEEFPEAEHELELMYDRMAMTAVRESDKLEATFTKRNLELQQLHVQEPPLKKFEDEYLQLMEDKTKFIAFIELNKQKAEKTRQAILKIRDAISGQNQDLTGQRLELSSIETAVAAQNLTPDEVNRMNHERESLSRGLDDLRTKIVEASQMAYDQEMLVTKSMDRFETLLADYTASCHQIGLLTRSADLTGQLDYKIEVDLGVEDLEDLRTSGIHMRSTVWQGLQNLRERYRQELIDLSDNRIALEDYCDRLGQQVEGQTEEVRTLEVKLKMINDQAELAQNKLNTENTVTNKTIFKLENDVTAMMAATQQGVLVSQSQLESTRIAYTELRHKATILHDSLVAQIGSHIDMIIKAKEHSANSLRSIKTLAETQ